MNVSLPVRLQARGRASAILIGLVAALIAWSPVTAAVTWGSVYRVSPNDTYSWGNAIARTQLSDGTTKLHAVYTQYGYSGVLAAPTGPYLGIYYRRGNASGSTWGTARRLNSTSAHGDHPAIDSSGRFVYVTWRRQPSSDATWNGADPRPLQFRRNTNHGDSSSWQTQPSFLGASAIDQPSLAATGAKVYIAYTDAIGAEIRLQKSTDYGKTFTYQTVGATTATGDGGYSGRPIVVATGNTVAVAWDDGTTTRIKVSLDAGATWSVDTNLLEGRYDQMDGDAASGRFAFVWNAPSTQALVMRRWNGSALGSPKTIVAVSDVSTYKTVLRPAIAMIGTSVIGVAYTACAAKLCSVNTGEAVRYQESRDSGASWKTKTVGPYNDTSSRRANEWPSVVFLSSTRRAVYWNVYGVTANDRMVVRVGSGTP